VRDGVCLDGGAGDGDALDRRGVGMLLLCSPKKLRALVLGKLASGGSEYFHEIK